MGNAKSSLTRITDESGASMTVRCDQVVRHGGRLGFVRGFRVHDPVFMDACARGDLETVQARWRRVGRSSRDSMFLVQWDPARNTPLHLAAYTDHGVVEWMLSKTVRGYRLLRKQNKAHLLPV